ncbi:MAG: TSUP family transporter [Oscillospiraceae bacterium]
MKKRSWRLALAAAAAGTVNGLFGGGGGMALLPLLSREPALEGRALFANSVAIILPLCLVSVAVSACFEPLPLKEALPYLLGGAAGAAVGARLFSKMPPAWLKRLFALFLFYAGVKYLL